MISNKYSLILAALICFVLLNAGTASAATYSGGSGTAEDPYQLSTDSDIDSLSTATDDWGMNFTLTNDITLEGNHTPIAPGAGFSGDFDGNGYIIKNLTINEDYINVGFFGYTLSTANIHDLGIETSSDGVYSITDTAGILIGRNDGIVNNCYATGNLTGQNFIGGLVGINYGIISNCYVTGTVSGNNNIAGLIGFNDGAINNCYATGNISGYDGIGGLVGYNNDAVNNSFTTSTVSTTNSDSPSIGNFIGFNLNDGTVTNCYYSGSTGDDYANYTSYDNFTDYNFISGASGLNWNSDGNLITIQDDPNYVWKIIDCYTLPFFQYQEINIDVPYSGGLGTTEHPYLLSTDADIDELSATPGNWSMNFKLLNNITLVGNHTPIGTDSTKFTGDFDGSGYAIKNLTIYTEDFDTGFFGHTVASTNIRDLGIETSSEGVYSTNSRVGGLVGYNYGTVSNCSVIGNVTGADYVGCLIGMNYDGTITNSSSSGNVTSSSGDVGGLTGKNHYGIIDNCSSSSTIFVKSSYNYYIGGLVGWNAAGTITNSYATGDVIGDTYTYTGGLIGENEAGTITNCYATGDVSGANKIGGLIGENYNTCTVTNSYATGNVNNSGQYTGGLIGNLDGISSINNCSATGNVTGSSDTGGLIGATYLTESTEYGIINNCYATGIISGAYGTGGLIGITSGDTVVTNSYATGTVENIDDAVGGLIGENLGSVSNCFATGTVTTTSINGFIGSLFGSNSGDVNNCYYSSSQGDSQGTYTSYANFTKLAFISGSSTLNWNENITTVDDSSFTWKIIEGYTLPFFQWQDTPNPVPYVETISQNSGFNDADDSTAVWINITGCSFNTTPTVNLVMDGQTSITGTIDSKTYTTINATFDISSAIIGDWSLYVTNPDSQNSTAKTFTVDSLPVLSTPVLSNTTGNFYVNWSWDLIESADSYNVSWNGTWYNGTTATEINDSDMDYHATSEITVLAYNETYGVLSDATSDSVTLANNPVSITNLNNIAVNESELITVDAEYSDLDEDTATFDCNRTDLFTDFNTSTGEGTWQTNYTSSGTYSVNFSVSDGYGSTDFQVVTITVTNVPATMYVGTSGYDFTSIQTAVDNAINGDTIIVTDGTYTENIVVDKSIIIRSENGAEYTTVTASDSSDHVFHVTADNVTINGFNVTGVIGDGDCGIYLFGSNNSIITNNIGYDNYAGIVVQSSDNNTITNNNLSNGVCGIVISYSNNNTLTNNNAGNNVGYDGISLLTSNNNTLTNNVVNENGRYGIYLDTSSNNTLSGNNVNNNGDDGIYIEDSSSNNLTENNVSDNGDDGIILYHSGDNNTLTGNIANGNVESGIQLSGSNNTIIADNIANGNGESGIDLGYSSNNNTVENNIAYENSIVGISIQSSIRNTLENNIANNNYFGIFLDASSNTLGNNTVTSNTEYDIVTIGANEIKDLKVTDNGARISFLSDGVETGIKGNVTNSTSLSGKTNVNGYLTIKRTDLGFKSADVEVTGSSTPNIIISYDDSDMSSSVESSIDLYKYNNSAWVVVSGTSLDTSSNTVTATLSEGTFGLFKDPESSSSSSSSSDSGSVATRVRSEGTISTLPTNSNGEVTGDTVVKSKDTITTLTLYKGTVGTDASGNPVSKIIVTTPASMPADTPKEVLESGLYYDFGPSGTTFSQDVLITIDFDPEEFEGKSPVIYTYSEENGWVALETTVDWENGRATAYTNHFSLYALFGDEGEEIVEEENSEVSAEFSESVEEDIEMPIEDEGGFGFVYLTIGIILIGFVGYIVVKSQRGEGGL